jgi:hypothetical protein
MAGGKTGRNAKQKQPAKAKKSKKSKRQMFVGPAKLPLGVSQLVRSMIDPWNQSSCIPDGSRYRSCFSVKATGTMKTGAAGTAVALVVNPGDICNFIALDDASTAITWTFPSGNGWDPVTDFATFQTLYGRYRPVSAGIRVVYIGTTLDDSGILVGGQFSGDTNLSAVADGASLTTIQPFLMSSATAPVRNGMEVVWMPADETNQKQFVRSSTTSALLGSYTSTVPQLFVGGLNLATAGAGIVQYDVVVNFEGQLENQTMYVGAKDVSMPPVDNWYAKTMSLLKDYVPAKAIYQAIGSLANGYVQKTLTTILSNQRSLTY